MFYKEDVNPCSKFKSADNPFAKLKKIIIICQKNLYYTQEVYKQAYDKGVKPKNYVFNDKILLNSKYIKILQN